MIEWWKVRRRMPCGAAPGNSVARHSGAVARSKGIRAWDGSAASIADSSTDGSTDHGTGTESIGTTRCTGPSSPPSKKDLRAG
jgi:hypothetical protein